MAEDLPESWRAIVDKVLPFAMRLKADMKRQEIYRGRRLCPEHHEIPGPVYVRARRDRRNGHMHMACDDPNCCMRLME